MLLITEFAMILLWIILFSLIYFIFHFTGKYQRERRLMWFGHAMRSNGEINRVRSRPVLGRKAPGRPKKTWDECVKQDLKVCGLSEAGTQDRVSWRSTVKNSRQEPTPSNGSAPQSIAAPPTRRVLGMRTRSFNKTGFDWFDWLMCVFVQKEKSIHTWQNALHRCGKTLMHVGVLNHGFTSWYLPQIFRLL